MVTARLRIQHHHSHLHVAWEHIEGQMGEVSICYLPKSSYIS